MNVHALGRHLANMVLMIITLSIAGFVVAQDKSENQLNPKAPIRQYVVILKRGPKWIKGKSVVEQPLLKRAQYWNEVMKRGSLQLAGPFLDDSGGLIVLNVADESEARQLVEHDPGILDQILKPEIIRPFRTAFDAATGKSPFDHMSPK